MSSQESALFGGRIVNVTDDRKIDEKHIYLEGDKEVSQGKLVQLRLGYLKSFSFFPGQSVLLRGSNIDGKQIVVEEIIQPTPAPKVPLTVNRVRKCTNALKGDPLCVMAAAGPFTCSDDTEFAPLKVLRCLFVVGCCCWLLLFIVVAVVAVVIVVVVTVAAVTHSCA